MKINKLTIAVITISSIIASIILIFFILLSTYFSFPNNEKVVVSVLFMISAALIISIMMIGYWTIKKRKEVLEESFYKNIEERTAASGLGVLIFNEDQEIIWTSTFIERRLGRTIIGKKISSISKNFENKLISGKTDFRFESDGIVFEAKIDTELRNIVLKDVTNEDILLRQYVSEKLVLGELQIDNYQQYQVTLSEEDLFKIQQKLIGMCDRLSEKYNFVYRQYVNGKYLFLTDNEAFEEMKKNKFNFLDYIRDMQVMDGINLTASIGIGVETSSFKDLSELARDGLKQSQARGGDQVAVMSFKKKPQYFGSKTEITWSFSKVKIKQTAEVLESKLKQSKIKNVIIYGHKYADLDALGAAMGVAEIAKAYEKKFYIQNNTFDQTTEKVMEQNFKKEDMQMFIKPSKAIKLTNHNTIVVIVDTAEMHRIENTAAVRKADPENIFVFDHHRVSKLPSKIPANNIYIDTASSSTSEIVIEIIHFLKKHIKIKKLSAQMMLNGIYLDTKNFTKSTSSRTYQAASTLEYHGASSSVASDILRIPESASQTITAILAAAEEVKKGYFMAVYDAEVEIDIVSKAADEMLRTQGRKAAFVIAKVPGKKQFKLSARSTDVNVQKIAEGVGGGGHYGAAAATSNEPLPIFTDNIRQAIISQRSEE